MINAARLSFQLGILSAFMIAFTFTARAQDNSLQTPDSDDGKTPVSLEAGISLKGTAWRRPNDTVGLANMAAGIGHAAQEYFNEGGLGIPAGDGKLPNYGWENVVELYYNFEVHKGVNVTFDYQFAVNPAFNEDRGPINILGARIDLKF
jgi:high affinity Mn2+ porin